LPVRNRAQDIFLQVRTKLNNFFGMVSGTEPAATATEGQKILMMTVRATDTGKALRKVTALKIALHNFRDYWSKKTIFAYIRIIIL